MKLFIMKTVVLTLSLYVFSQDNNLLKINNLGLNRTGAVSHDGPEIGGGCHKGPGRENTLSLDNLLHIMSKEQPLLLTRLVWAVQPLPDTRELHLSPAKL